MPSSPWVKLDLIVFDTPLRAKALLKSFEKCVKSNITEPGLETVGKACTFTLKTGEALPAFRNSVWMDMDCEDALDEWANQVSNSSPAFLLLESCVNYHRKDYPAMIWWKVPGGPLETFADLEGDLIADRIGVASKWVVDVENEEFLGTVMELSLETADLAPLKTHLDALTLSNHTPNTRTPRSPLRI